jgi:hypothetical protein
MSGSIGAAEAKLADRHDSERGGNAKETLLGSLSDDVYSYTVMCLINKERGFRLLKVVLAMVVTFALQMGLLFLLWEGLLKGGDTGLVARGGSETDKLWRQVGQVQRQVCWLNKHAMIDPEVPVEAGLNCSGAWSSHQGCEGPMSFESFSKCVRTLGLRPSAQWYQDGGSSVHADRNAASAVIQEEKEACKGFEDLDTSQRWYGFGLLFPEYATINGTGGGSAWDLSNATWFKDSVPGERASHQDCMPPVLNPHVSDPSFVNLMAFLVLAVYVHEEIVKAVRLGYLTAVFAGILPAFFSSDQAAGADVAVGMTPRVLSCFGKSVMLFAPVLQLLTCFMVLTSSMALGFVQETQVSRVAIILSNVALTFILDVDNRIGSILAKTHGKVVGVSSGFGSGTTNGQSTGGTMTKLLGHAYMALLGLFILAEPMFLSPLFGWELYASIGGRVNKGLSLDRLWQRTALTAWTRMASMVSSYDRNEVYVAHVPSIGLSNSAQAWNNDYNTSINMLTMMGKEQPLNELIGTTSYLIGLYSCGVALFVFLFFGDILPSPLAKRWAPVLLALQVVLGGLSCITVIQVPFWSYFVLCMWVIAWVGMFVLWPSRHRPPAPQPSGPGPLGGGSAGSLKV